MSAYEYLQPRLTEIPAHYVGQAAAEEGVRLIAREIADDMIQAARASGGDPIAWVTGNRYQPALRSYAGAELVYQAQYPGVTAGDYWELLNEELDSFLAEASVALECPEWDNALYVCDLRRFKYVESETGENLQDDWEPIGS